MNNDTIVDWGKVFQGDIVPLDFVFGGLLAGTVGGIGDTSEMSVTSKSQLASARIADSLPAPGPLT